MSDMFIDLFRVKDDCTIAPSSDVKFESFESGSNHSLRLILTNIDESRSNDKMNKVSYFDSLLLVGSGFMVALLMDL